MISTIQYYFSKRSNNKISYTVFVLSGPKYSTLIYFINEVLERLLQTKLYDDISVSDIKFSTVVLFRGKVVNNAVWILLESVAGLVSGIQQTSLEQADKN